MANVGRPKGLAKPPGSGRKKGVSGKQNMTAKRMLEFAMMKKGGADYLIRQADENPVAFMRLWGMLLPRTIDATITHHLTVERLLDTVTDYIDAETDDETD